MASSVTVRAGIACDEVRREDNGKLILIGAYTSNIVVTELPAVLVLALVIQFESAEPAEMAIEFRAKLDDATLRTGKGRVTLASSGTNWIVVPGVLLENVAQEGRLQFDIRTTPDGEWTTACSLPLVLRKPSGPIAPQPPS